MSIWQTGIDVPRICLVGKIVGIASGSQIIESVQKIESLLGNFTQGVDRVGLEPEHDIPMTVSGSVDGTSLTAPPARSKITNQIGAPLSALSMNSNMRSTSDEDISDSWVKALDFE